VDGILRAEALRMTTFSLVILRTLVRRIPRLSLLTVILNVSEGSLGFQQCATITAVGGILPCPPVRWACPPVRWACPPVRWACPPVRRACPPLAGLQNDSKKQKRTKCLK